MKACKPTSWPYRLWPVSGLWNPDRYSLFRELKALNWKWSGRLKLPLWLRVWCWIDTNMVRHHELAEKWSPVRITCQTCEAGNLPYYALYCHHCGEDVE